MSHVIRNVKLCSLMDLTKYRIIITIKKSWEFLNFFFNVYQCSPRTFKFVKIFKKVSSTLSYIVKWHVWWHVCYYIDPKFTEFLLISHFFGTGAVSFYFLLIKLSMLFMIKNEKKRRQNDSATYRGPLQCHKLKD